MMNVAIIGLGKISDYHINAIKKNSNLNLIGGFDVKGDPEGKLNGVKLYSSEEELLSDPEVESVILLVPLEFKQEIGERILESGKNLLTEKPAVKSLEDLDKLQEIATRQGKIIYGFFHSRYSPTAKEIVRMLKEGEFKKDDIVKIEISADSPHIDWDNKIMIGKSSEKTSFTAEGANILAELFVYIDQLEIEKFQSTKPENSDLPLEVQTTFEGKSGDIQIIGTTSWIRNKKEKKVRIIFKDGRELIAKHTEQIIFNENGEILFDATFSDKEISRMQKEYNAMYQDLETEISRGGNLELLRVVVEAMKEKYYDELKIK